MPLFSRRPELLRNGLDAWLMLIASDRPEQILKVIRAYPEFEEIYRQVFGFRRQVKELMNMFSDLILENLGILIDFIYICNIYMLHRRIWIIKRKNQKQRRKVNML